jgi:hypothetical protein
MRKPSLSVLTLLWIGCWSGTAPCLKAQTGYEVDGIIDQTIFSHGDPRMTVSSKFKVFVRDCGWFIETTETYVTATSRRVSKRAVGSANGTETVEMVYSSDLVPEARRPTATNSMTKRTQSQSFDTAMISTNAVPVGQLDGSVVGHLWLMLSSKCYLAGLKTNMLTPVYDVSASAPGNPNLKVRTHWDLMAGPGSLPSRVVFFDGYGAPTGAVYQVTGFTNVDGNVFPTGFLFEQRIGDDAMLRKQSSMVVTRISPVCSRGSLLPQISQDTIIADRRLAPSGMGANIPAYQVPADYKWQTMSEARKRYEMRKELPKGSPVVFLVLGVLFCAPLVACTIRLLRRWYQKP